MAFAPGIEDKNNYPELPNAKGKIWEYSLQEHHAKIRGKHHDLRLGDPDTGHGHSWALEELPKPGQTAFAIHQPVHSIDYFNFKGEIPSGYGAGKVHIKERDKVEVVNSKPGHISFNVYRGYGPEEYTLHRMGDSKIWKLYNKTPTKESLNLPLHRPKYREMNINKIDDLGEDYLMSAKIDDAHQLFLFDNDKIRSFSYRESSKAPSGLIEHTHKLNLPNQKGLNNTILRGGIYGTKDGKAISSTTLGGLLNSNVWKSRKNQEELGKLKPILYDVVEYKGKDYTDKPYSEKLKVLEKIKEKVPYFELPETAISKEDKNKLLDKIKKKEHSQTEEGVVFWELNKSSPPIKVKLFQDKDVYIRGFFGGQGKYKDKGVGGFTFSHTKDGPIVGRVGTGLSDKLREDMHKNPDKYKNLVATVSSQQQYSKGALRVPAFKNFHIDKNESLNNVVLK